MQKLPLEERFWAKVDKRGEDDCWPWLASHTKGYGFIGRGVDYRGPRKQVERAHRISWELHVGDIPDDLQVLHSCDNPGCVNPRHLFLGTNLDNVADRVAKGRTSRHHLAALVRHHPELRPRGEKHGRAKITAGDVRRIRATCDRTSGAEWALRLGISQNAVSHIRTRKTWKHIP